MSIPTFPLTPEEPPLDAAALERIRDLVITRFGVKIGPSRDVLLRHRLLARMQETDCHRLEDYEALLHVEDGELELFINSLTTNFTDFFREPHHFELLAQDVIRGSLSRKRLLRIWSAGTSTGQEAVSAAMVLASLDRIPFRIWATDVDSGALRAARAGVYPAVQVATIERRLKRMYLLKGVGAQSGLVRVGPVLLNHIDYERHNLVADPAPRPGEFDVIFCRNVAIYFETEVQLRVYQMLVDSLAVGGLLFIGHSESLLGRIVNVDSFGRSAYRKVGR